MGTPIYSGIAGDVNGDGVVDCTDLAIVQASLARRYGEAGFNPRADTNGDGVIDVLDYAFVAQQLAVNASCP
jgi:trimeric autotransporter adhesin